ncbi:MAG: hypothetical protein IJU37_05715 [Desulfovibrio sp.]|nr:hypothetical protein [Desulfovibrio sp.]
MPAINHTIIRKLSPMIPIAVTHILLKNRGILLWWLLPLFLLLLFLILLFSSFGSLPALSGLNLPHFSALPFTNTYDVHLMERRYSESKIEIDRLREKALARASSCTPARPSQSLQPTVTPIPPTVVVQHSHQTEQAERKQDLIIPPNADNLDFILGRWHYDTGIENMRTHEPVIFEFAFNAHGKGQGICP